MRASCPFASFVVKNSYSNRRPISENQRSTSCCIQHLTNVELFSLFLSFSSVHSRSTGCPVVSIRSASDIRAHLCVICG